MSEAIEIKRREVSTADGKKFYAYKILCKDGRYMDCCFVRAITSKIPDKDIFYIARETLKGNVNTNRKYPRMWVTDFEECDAPEHDNVSLEEYI